MGEKMLSPARNFLMVPPALNQLCLFSCWALRNSLLRCFHCCEVNVLRILPHWRIKSYIMKSIHLHLTNISYFLSCRPRLKPSLLDGWNTSTDGSVYGGQTILQSAQLLAQRPKAPLRTPSPTLTHQVRRGTEREKSAVSQ